MSRILIFDTNPPQADSKGASLPQSIRDLSGVADQISRSVPIRLFPDIGVIGYEWSIFAGADAVQSEQLVVNWYQEFMADDDWLDKGKPELRRRTRAPELRSVFEGLVGYYVPWAREVTEEVATTAIAVTAPAVRNVNHWVVQRQMAVTLDSDSAQIALVDPAAGAPAADEVLQYWTMYTPLPVFGAWVRLAITFSGSALTNLTPDELSQVRVMCHAIVAGYAEEELVGDGTRPYGYEAQTDIGEDPNAPSTSNA